MTITNPGRCLRSADKLLLPVPHTSVALSAKAFSVSTLLSGTLSLSFNCRSYKFFSTFARTLKTELFDTAYSEHSTWFLPSHASDLLATHGAIKMCLD